LKEAGFKLLILTREENPVVRKRAAKLGVEIIHGERNKLEALKKWAVTNNLDKNHIVYIGNDVNDLEAIKWAGFSFAPSDAHHEVLRSAKVVLSAKGGEGVIRQLADIMVK
jgi:N-acylneuraminate cytidylyltransferase